MLKTGDSGFRTEEAAKHAADLVGGKRNAGLVGVCLQTGCQPFRGVIQMLVEAIGARQFQRRQTGGK